MMNTTGWDYGFIALWSIHVLSVIAFFTGVLFFFIFAIKTFNTTQLKNWAIWLMVIGTIACLATIAVTGRPWVGFGFYGGSEMNGTQMQMMGRMMEMMMQHDRGATGTQRTDHEDMEKMMRMMLSPAGSS